jgi:hypothetical protein
MLPTVLFLSFWSDDNDPEALMACQHLKGVLWTNLKYVTLVYIFHRVYADHLTGGVML